MASKYAQSWKVKILELGIFTMLDFLRQYVQLVQTLLQGFLNNPNLRDNSVIKIHRRKIDKLLLKPFCGKNPVKIDLRCPCIRATSSSIGHWLFVSLPSSRSA